MAKGIKRKVEKVIGKIEREVIASIDPDNRYSRGLAWEGYQGGYRDALNDVLLVLNGVTPQRRFWWDSSPTRAGNEGNKDSDGYIARQESAGMGR